MPALPMNVAAALALFVGAGPSGVDATAFTDAMKTEALERHNKYRCMHGVPLMTWDDDVAQFASDWADSMASRTSMSHSEIADRTRDGVVWGENLAQGQAGIALATKDWYDEIELITANDKGLIETFSEETAHYAQVVWKESTALGCGFHGDYWACGYKPGGNTDTMYTYNVLQLWHTEAECVDPANPTGTPAPAGRRAPAVCTTDQEDAVEECINGTAGSASAADSCTQFRAQLECYTPPECCTDFQIDELNALASTSGCTETFTCPTAEASAQVSAGPRKAALGGAAVVAAVMGGTIAL